MIGIYKFTNKINNKSYIGQSIHIEQRYKSHIAHAYYPPSNEYNSYFHKAIRKYGIDNFTFEIICICQAEELDVLETFYIEKYHSLTPDGYNITRGGEHSWSTHHQFTKDDVREIIHMLRTTDLSADDIAQHWNCSASLIKKISYGEQYFLDDESYPIRDEAHIQRVHRKYSLWVQGINPSAKLDIHTVEDIVYDLLNTDIKIKDLAIKYNICTDQISRINNGKIWLQVERPIPCRNTIKDNQTKALMVADLLLNTQMSQKEIMLQVGYKDRHTIARINQHQIYQDLLVNYPNPIRQ